VKELRATLDPVRLLQQIRAAQQQLVDIADRPALGEAAKTNLADIGGIPLGASHGMEGGRGAPDQRSKAKAKAQAAAASA
jgi:hypothetical protein